MSLMRMLGRSPSLTTRLSCNFFVTSYLSGLPSSAILSVWPSPLRSMPLASPKRVLSASALATSMMLPSLLLALLYVPLVVPLGPPSMTHSTSSPARPLMPLPPSAVPSPLPQTHSLSLSPSPSFLALLRLARTLPPSTPSLLSYALHPTHPTALPPCPTMALLVTRRHPPTTCPPRPPLILPISPRPLLHLIPLLPMDTRPPLPLGRHLSPRLTPLRTPHPTLPRSPPLGAPPPLAPRSRPLPLPPGPPPRTPPRLHPWWLTLTSLPPLPCAPSALPVTTLCWLQ